MEPGLARIYSKINQDFFYQDVQDKQDELGALIIGKPESLPFPIGTPMARVGLEGPKTRISQDYKAGLTKIFFVELWIYGFVI